MARTDTQEPLRPDLVAPAGPRQPRAIGRSLLVGSAALVGWGIGAWFAWRSVGPFYRPGAVGPFLTAGAALAATVGIILAALARQHDPPWWPILQIVFIVTAAIPPAAVHTVPALRQLTEHPLLGDTEVYTAGPEGHAELYLVRGENDIITLTDTSASEISSALSPDGRSIVFGSDQDGSFDLYLMSLDEDQRPTGIRRLTSLQSDEFPMEWSPDGSTISFDVVENDTWNVATIRPDGTGLTLLTNDGSSSGGTWSPDGTELAFAHPASRGEPWGIWAMRPDGTDRHLIVEIDGNAYGPWWSPAGNMILFTSNGSGNEDVWVARSDGWGARDLTVGWKDDDQAVGWSSDGSALFASTRSHTGGNFIYAMEPDGGDVRLVVII